MKRGPKPKSPESKNRHGSQRGDLPDTRTKLEAKMPSKPDWLTEIGSKQWDMIAEPLFLSGLITDIDSGALALYCDAMADYINVTDKLENLRKANADEKDLIAWYKIKNRIWLAATKLMVELHLTPGDTGRVIIPLPKTPKESKSQKWVAKNRA